MSFRKYLYMSWMYYKNWIRQPVRSSAVTTVAWCFASTECGYDLKYHLNFKLWSLPHPIRNQLLSQTWQSRNCHQREIPLSNTKDWKKLWLTVSVKKVIYVKYIFNCMWRIIYISAAQTCPVGLPAILARGPGLDTNLCTWWALFLWLQYPVLIIHPLTKYDSDELLIYLPKTPVESIGYSNMEGVSV